MNITNEIKAKVFAQYYNNMYVSEGRIYCLTGERLDNIQCGEKAQLILKPLSAITDEDAIEVANIMGADYTAWTYQGRVDFVKDYLKSVNKSWYTIKDGQTTNIVGQDAFLKAIIVYHFLVSKGYDLPHYLLGGKTLHKAGLAIYENEK